MLFWIHRNLFNQTVLLQELLAPQRYPEVLLHSPGMQPVSAAVGKAPSSAQQQANKDGMLADASDGLSASGVEEAAAEVGSIFGAQT